MRHFWNGTQSVDDILAMYPAADFGDEYERMSMILRDRHVCLSLCLV